MRNKWQADPSSDSSADIVRPSKRLGQHFLHDRNIISKILNAFDPRFDETVYKVRNPFDPKANIEAGIKHLKSLIEQFDDDIELVLAAYNAGEGAVKKFNGIPPYRETRNYVSRILSIAGLK